MARTRRCWALALVLCVGCGLDMTFEQTVTLGESTRAQVELARPGLRAPKESELKASQKASKKKKPSRVKTTLVRVPNDGRIVMELYGFDEDGVLVMLSVTYHASVSTKDVAQPFLALNGRPDQNVQVAGGEVVGWERSAQEVAIIRFPGKNEFELEDEDGEPIKVPVGALLWMRLTEGAGGPLRLLILGLFLLLSGGAAVVLWKLKTELEQSGPGYRWAEPVGSVAILLGGGLLMAGFGMEQLEAGDAVALVLLAPAGYINLKCQELKRGLAC